MLDNRKITLMARLALFEKESGKEDFRLARYYRTDYIRFEMLKTFVCTTAAFLLTAGMCAVYKAEYFLKQAADMKYEKFLFLVLAGYLLLLTGTELVTFFLSSHHIKMSRKKLGKYYYNLRTLRKYYKENEE